MSVDIQTPGDPCECGGRLKNVFKNGELITTLCDTCVDDATWAEVITELEEE